jgi:hypothetical protein
MSEGSLFLDFLRKFERLGLEYMVTGSVASTMYGEPRVTHDVDVVLIEGYFASSSTELSLLSTLVQLARNLDGLPDYRCGAPSGKPARRGAH